jgi:CheY-like chemotaxis protein
VHPNQEGLVPFRLKELPTPHLNGSTFRRLDGIRDSPERQPRGHRWCKVIRLEGGGRCLKTMQLEPGLGPMDPRHKRILVVDDEQPIRDILSKMLTWTGFEVDVAGTGREGLHLFRKMPFDLVITDLEMPGMNGWVLTSEIKKNSPQTPVLVVTGSHSEDLAEKKAEVFADGVIFKPFRWVELNKALQKLLSKGYRKGRRK